MADATLQRLEASAARIAELRTLTAAEMERRAELVTQAIDEGETYRKVGRAARIAHSRIARILAAQHTKDLHPAA